MSSSGAAGGRSKRPRVLLVHWHHTEAEERAARLSALGYDVTLHWDKARGSNVPPLRTIASDPPAAVVLDLARLPSHASGIAAWLRERKATRTVPLVFVPGDAEKTARLRQRFPDATFSTWARMRTALPRSIAKPPREPVVPAAPDYPGAPLPRKLGIKPDTRVVFVRAPADFAATLGELPAGVEVASRLVGEAAVVVLFCRSLRQLQADFPRASGILGERGGLWVAWPKKAAGQLTDLDQQRVQALGLDAGLVDNKVCAIDATWSGLRFARRRAR